MVESNVATLFMMRDDRKYMIFIYHQLFLKSNSALNILQLLKSKHILIDIC